MSWDQLSRYEKINARHIQEALGEAGVTKGDGPVSVSQVGRYYADAVRWQDGDVPLATLCRKTGWAPPETPSLEELHRRRTELQESLAAVEQQIAKHE
jgi:hypothetical protein